MTNEKLNVPELRFPGFIEEWCNTDVGQVVNVYDGTHQTPKYTNKGIKFLSVENIKTLKSNKFISKEAFEKDFKVRPEFGDVLMTRIGDVGTPKVVNSNEDLAYYVSLALLKPKSIHPYFLESLIKSPTIQNEIWRKTLHIAFPKKINKNEIAKIMISYPKSEEQQKIGDFFSKLDRQIELEEQKLEKLEQHKKGYMQKIFSQQLRFKDEWGNNYAEWEDDILKNIGETFSGLSGKTKDDFGHGNAEFITYMNVFKNIIANENMTEKVYISNNERQSNVQYNDILFTTSSEVPNEVGMSSIWLYNKENVYLNSFCFGFRVLDNRINPVFLTRFLRSDNMRKIITILAQGSTRFNISKKEIMKLPIKIPLLNEQNKINDFLITIEKAVNTQSKKINKLKSRKQALLQKMFV